MRNIDLVENEFIEEWRASENRARLSSINEYQRMHRGARRRSIMAKKRIDGIEWMERSRKQNKHAVKSMKVENGIGNVGRGRGIAMTGSRNVEAKGESLRSLDGVGGTSAEGAGRSRDLEWRRRHRRGRREGHRLLNASISDRHTERLYQQSLKNGSKTTSEKSINYRE
jgi:hypothetical protein